MRRQRAGPYMSSISRLYRLVRGLEALTYGWHSPVYSLSGKLHVLELKLNASLEVFGHDRYQERPLGHCSWKVQFEI